MAKKKNRKKELRHKVRRELQAQAVAQGKEKPRFASSKEIQSRNKAVFESLLGTQIRANHGSKSKNRSNSPKNRKKELRHKARQKASVVADELKTKAPKKSDRPKRSEVDFDSPELDEFISKARRNLDRRTEEYIQLQQDYIEERVEIKKALADESLERAIELANSVPEWIDYRAEMRGLGFVGGSLYLIPDLEYMQGSWWKEWQKAYETVRDLTYRDESMPKMLAKMGVDIQAEGVDYFLNNQSVPPSQLMGRRAEDYILSLVRETGERYDLLKQTTYEVRNIPSNTGM